VEAAARRRVPSSSPVGRLASSDSIATGNFTPGLVLLERYRIIGLLGRGGMGEVYRADDLKLGQPVALKFLPRHLAADAGRLERFYAEVRLARQVSHPNVCRVYDVGEVDGNAFLSMEYVDGEDLASLLKRIGRLPSDKALEISRELCAGLAAAHDRGVLHRDLKPANVMIDGRGRARITDFGLAVAAGAATNGEISGTPAYMAPEQLAGMGASVRSDVYALGLVLYELYTGRKAFDGATLQELTRKHSESTPAAPSAIAPGLEPAVERVILRCLEKDPAARPGSAAQIMKALPGGDPLAAAIAAGETPSPEMVAAAGEPGAISPPRARALLAGLAAAVALSLWLSPRANIASFVGMEKSPEVLREKAREILRSVGIGRPADSASWFHTDGGFLVWRSTHGGFGRGLVRDAVALVYRQSPTPLMPILDTGPYPLPRVDSTNPPPRTSGMAEISVDPIGRLVRLSVVPPELVKDGSPTPPTDWSVLFRAAGLDEARFHPVEPRWSPPDFATERAAWEGPHPEIAGVPMRLEAASFRGRPVSFIWVGPWTEAAREPESAQLGMDAGTLVFLALLLLLLLGGGALARANLRAGRGDRRSALRLAVVMYLALGAMWVLGGHHIAGPLEGWMLISAFTNAVGMALGFWIIYVALEPVARRRWPQMLISWTRAFAGRWRDPLVGRDALIGAVVGAAAGLILGPGRVLLPMRLGVPGYPPHLLTVGGPIDIGSFLAWTLSDTVYSVVWVLGIVFLLILVRSVVRLNWLAGVVVTLLYVGNYLSSPSLGLTLPLGALSIGIVVAVVVRYGVLAAVVAEAFRHLFGYRIYSSDPSNWAFYTAVLAVAIAVAAAWWGARTALAGRPLFGEASAARIEEA
jgi:hypothetical protein